MKHAHLPFAMLAGLVIGGCSFNSSDIATAEVKTAPAMPVKPLVQHLVFFEWDKSGLPDNVSTILAPHVLYLVKNPTQRLLIEGAADESGDYAYNVKLGLSRAKAVEALLLNEGIRKEQLIVRSIGIERPLNLDKTAHSLPRNRRVTLAY
jgi:peptidoglycan-associated lipoprotein